MKRKPEFPFAANLKCPEPRNYGIATEPWPIGGQGSPLPATVANPRHLSPGRRARSDAPYPAAIQRGRWPVLGLINTDPGILHPPECFRSALATEAGVITKRSACAKQSAGRAGSLLPAAVSNPRVRVYRVGAHRVTRPTCPTAAKNYCISGSGSIQPPFRLIKKPPSGEIRDGGKKDKGNYFLRAGAGAAGAAARGIPYFLRMG